MILTLWDMVWLRALAIILIVPMIFGIAYAVINKPLIDDGLTEFPDLSFEFWAPKGYVKLSKGSWFGFQKVHIVKEDEKMKTFSQRKIP